jgi:hypothetical protein
MCLAVVTACGLGDLLSAPRARDVVLTYVGDTALAVGDTIPLAVIVLVEGDTLSNPRLSVTSSSDTVVAVLSGGDSLAALSRGSATVTIRFANAIFTESVPSTVVTLCVNMPFPTCPVPP